MICHKKCVEKCLFETTCSRKPIPKGSLIGGGGRGVVAFGSLWWLVVVFVGFVLFKFNSKATFADNKKANASNQPSPVKV